MYQRERIMEFSGRTPEEMPESRPEEMPNELYKDREVITPNGPEKPEKNDNNSSSNNYSYNNNISNSRGSNSGFMM